MDERHYKIDQERYRRKGMTKDEARIAVDRLDKLTDAQITALCKDGNPPHFTAIVPFHFYPNVP